MEDFDFACDITGGLSGVHWWTFKNKLSVSYSFNEGQWKAKDLQKLLTALKTQLLDGLGI